jgi:hypothetical protein
MWVVTEEPTPSQAIGGGTWVYIWACTGRVVKTIVG